MQTKALETHVCLVCACVPYEAADRNCPPGELGKLCPASPGPGARPCHPSGTSCLSCKIRWAQMELPRTPASSHTW